MKTTFSRQYALIAGLLLVCMLVTGVSFWFLMRSYVGMKRNRRCLRTRTPWGILPGRITPQANWRTTGAS